MAEENNFSQYGFVIDFIKEPNGKMFYQVHIQNTGVPLEIVIMQLRTLIKKMDRDYFKDSEDDTLKFKTF